MSFESRAEFGHAVRNMPKLPVDDHGEWYEVLESSWVGGIFYRDRQDPNTTVALHRTANNETEFGKPVINYGITIGFGDRDQLAMDPQSAIDLGVLLLTAGTAALSDLADHDWFLSGGPE